MFDFTGKIAIVTGASRGIGKSIAVTFARAGMHVICASRTLEDLKKTVQSIKTEGASASAFRCDVSDQTAFKSLVDDTITKYGKIDILVNNAGLTKDGLLMRMSSADWDTVLNVNLKGAFNGIKSVARTMMSQRSGRIINITSVVGLTGNAGQANYSASKAGLMGLSKSTAKELASRGITSNCIAPGFIKTAMTENLPEKAKEKMLTQIPLGRLGNPEDIAAMALFLASEEAGYITGQTFVVDGGMVIN